MCLKEVSINEDLDTYNKITEVLVVDKNDETKTIKIIGMITLLMKRDLLSVISMHQLVII